MKKVSAHIASIIMFALFLSINIAHAQTQVSNTDQTVRSRTVDVELRFSTLQAHVSPMRRAGFSLMPEGRNVAAGASGFSFKPMAAGNLPVTGNGTLGRLTKWTSFTGSNSIIGDTTIFEDKFGMVGIGTDTPTSRLTVAGMIQTLSGGVTFPDNTIQVTAGIAPNQVVRSLNGLMGDLTLLPGSNISITPGSNSLTIGASVIRDPTLTGNGTSAAPLGIKVPIFLTASVGGNAVIRVLNTGAFGAGVIGEGATMGGSSFGGSGVGGIGGRSTSGSGGDGVRGSGGESSSGPGGPGVVAEGGNSDSGMGGPGVIADGGSGPLGPGLAGNFLGNVDVSGVLSKTAGSFKIDHPLDPENRYLYHSFVESPDMMNIYNGNITTDANGEAVVSLPDYFEALNQDFRYQLTVIGTFAQAIVAQKIRGNQFLIRTSAPGVEVSWQVTGVRQDAWAKRNRIRVEVEKSERERGYFLHPEAFDRPEELSIEWARNPDMMKQRKEARARTRLKNPQSNER